MRFVPYVALAAALLLPGAVYAQQVTIAGWVDRVDAANSTITIRTLANTRTITVAPDAGIRINGVASRLEQLPFNSAVSIVAEKDANGVLHATQISVQATGRQPAAAAPPGAIVRGTLVGINLPENAITVRTPSGDYPVALGTASIYVNGAPGSSRDLRLGQMVEVDRSQPTPASTDYVTQIVRVLPTGGPTAAPGARTAAPRGGTPAARIRPSTSTAAGTPAASSAGANALTGAGIVERGRPITRTRGYVATYRSRRTRTYYHRVRTHRRIRHYRIRRRMHRRYRSRRM